jgi:O-antigen ligase
VGEDAIHPKGGNVPQFGRRLNAGKRFRLRKGGLFIGANVFPRRARLGALGWQHMDALTPVVSRSRLPIRSAIVEQALLWAFIVGLAWCPFWFGSNVLLAWGANAVLFPALVIIYELSLLIRGERHPVAITQIKVPAALFAAVVVWILIQNATWTPAWLHHPIWQMSAKALEKPIDGSISVNRDLTTLALLRLITAASVLWIAIQLCRDASRANLLLWAVAVIGCAYAAYGLFAFALTRGHVLWFENPDMHFVTSTFINPNSFVAYAGIGFITICGLILRLYRHEFAAVGGSIRFRVATFIGVTGQKGAALLGGALLVLVAVLLSGSRGGIISSALALFVLAALTLRPRRRQFAEQREAVIACGALLVAATFLVFGDLVVGKIAERGLGDESRMAVYTIAMRSVLAAPVLGYGYGTFADVFPMFRDQSVSTWGKWEMAHNTYLEVFQGLGLVFGSLLVASVVLLVLRCVKGAMTRQTNETVPCVAASVAFLLGVHVLVDFSLQMQAIAITFMALLGAGVAQSESSRLVLED